MLEGNPFIDMLASFAGWGLLRLPNRSALMMVRRVSEVSSVPLSPIFQVETIVGSQAAPEGWVEVLQEAGFKTTTTSWGSEFPENRTVGVIMIRTSDHEVVGTFGVLKGSTPSSVLLHLLGASPSQKGRGLGKALTLLACNLSFTSGSSKAFLTTDDHRLAAIKVYLSAGFCPYLGSWDRTHYLRWRRIGRLLGVRLEFEVPSV